STGRRNELGKPLAWFHPPECLSRASVELSRDEVEALLRDPGERHPLREVLAQEPVGVLVRAALPGAVRVAEVDADAGIDAEPEMLSHLPSLVPGERSAEVRGKT